MCCKCIFSCWEDFYWNCIEEKFCFDESLVNYDPDEDEHAAKNKNKNGYYGSPAGDSGENNNTPICRQPGVSSGLSIPRNISKIHEDDLRREIQTNVPMLAPEVMAIFANSQIFQSSAPPKQPTSKATSPASVKFAISDSGSPIEVTPVGASTAGNRRELSSDKLLQRLEGSSGSSLDERDSRIVVIPAIVEEDDGSDEGWHDSEVVLRPPRNFSELSLSKSIPSNKTISHLQADLPYFSIRPASENDIFTISGGAGGSTYNSISMTPEVPAISYSNLPKNYLETPVIEKYRESVSLYSIQTAGINRQSQTDDLSMPRYYGKSDLFVSGIDRANSRSADAVEMGRSDDGSGSLTFSSSSLAKGGGRSRNVERSKRLMNLRTALPPLNLGLVRGSSASNLRDRREDRESRERDKSEKRKEGLRV
ncbi:AGAP008658-PA [Anopheles gambiae str. PEST]|uniref:AGAP008658-PA n=1 Tax=Anopheles gambiae TaxID=7165 RepID=Q5TS81_ANOGA|nr:AGAP008658-PA [Anopheles gambiae str. PEST]